MIHPALPTQPTRRRRDLDLIGVFVVAGLVFFHTAQIFSPFGLFIKNAPPDLADPSQLIATAFILFTALWGMPLMFLVAGMAIWFSLHKRTVREFAGERVRRLLVPFVTGLLIFAPFNLYIILRQQDPPQTGDYLPFLRSYFDVEFDLTAPLFLSGANELFSLSHMWFLIYLFGYSLLLLPLFLFLRRPAGQPWLAKSAALIARPGAIFLLALPLAMIQAGLGTPNAGIGATWNLWAYAVFLAYGFLFAADARFEQSARRHRKSALVLGMVSSLVYLVGFYVLGNLAGGGAVYGPGFVLLRFLQGTTGWLLIVAIIGWVSAFHLQWAAAAPGAPDAPARDLAKPPALIQRMARYASEAQLPFYVLHLTPIVVIGSIVVQWEMNVLLKYLVIVITSLLATLMLYEIGVRRTGLTRFLFGVKPVIDPPQPAPSNQRLPEMESPGAG